MISSIDTLGGIRPITSAATEKESEIKVYYPDETGLFETIFRSAINNVKETDAEKVEAQYLLSTGQLDNPAALNIAISKNQLAVDLLVQLRNKALDVYSEITRISM